jgi:hypothetical protein
MKKHIIIMTASILLATAVCLQGGCMLRSPKKVEKKAKVESVENISISLERIAVALEKIAEKE